MRHLKVILYDEEAKSIIEHDCIPDGELELSGINDSLFVDVFLRVEELMVGSNTYRIMSRRFSIEGGKLIINVRLKT